MSYFVTGATGFIGRRLIHELVDHRDGEIFVLCRQSSLGRMQLLIDEWGSDRVVPIVGDLGSPGLGVDPKWIKAQKGRIDHFFHLAAIYDITADDATNDALNIQGTRYAMDLAAQLDAGVFHQVSSVAAAGDYRGTFTEDMFDEGQPLPSPYHRTKFESEKMVREESTVPWRIYRPSLVIGDSVTGEMDKVDGPYYLFPMIKRLRDAMPSWIPLVGIDLRDTNVVPVDYVAKAMDHLAHLSKRDGEVFHLVNPEPQSVIDMVNAFCAAAGAPTFATPIDRRFSERGPIAKLPNALKPATILSNVVRSTPAQATLDQTVGRLGLPAEALAHVNLTATYDSRKTQKALAGSGIEVPPLESYVRTLWSYWEEQMDDSTTGDKKVRKALKDKYVVITGASSGIGLVTAVKVAQAGGIPVLVARGKDKLEALQRTIEINGGTAHVFAADLSDYESIDDLARRLNDELPRVDFLINNAGRSIRRSLKLSYDRFHDFERTMQLNYFGAIRLIMGVLPGMTERRSGHIVNVSSIAVLTSTPRFSAYTASKSALDSWSNVAASELAHERVTFTNIHMPLVRTPMIAPTKMYDRFPTISPAQAADMLIEAMVEKPHEINTLAGYAGNLLQRYVPKSAHRVLNVAYQLFPDSAAAKAHIEDDGHTGAPAHESQREMVVRLFKGLKW